MSARSTEAEYLAWDLAHEGRHEFVNGQIVAMAGAGEEHGIVVTNATLAFGNRLRGSTCRVFVADLRVRIDETACTRTPTWSSRAANVGSHPPHPRACSTPRS